MDARLPLNHRRSQAGQHASITYFHITTACHPPTNLRDGCMHAAQPVTTQLALRLHTLPQACTGWPTHPQHHHSFSPKLHCKQWQLTAGVHRLANTLRASEGAFDHLRTTRDVFGVQLAQLQGVRQVAAAAGSRGEGGASSSSGAQQAQAPYECPVTQLPCTRWVGLHGGTRHASQACWAP